MSEVVPSVAIYLLIY